MVFQWAHRILEFLMRVDCQSGVWLDTSRNSKVIQGTISDYIGRKTIPIDSRYGPAPCNPALYNDHNCMWWEITPSGNIQSVTSAGGIFNQSTCYWVNNSGAFCNAPADLTITPVGLLNKYGFMNYWAN